MLEIRSEPVRPHIESSPEPSLFVTASGAHLYGFPSMDSDYDLRGAHVTPIKKVVSLDPPRETRDTMDRSGPVEIDFVTHDVRKLFLMLLKKSGYVLEQICSPIVLTAAAEFEELRALAARCPRVIWPSTNTSSSACATNCTRRASARLCPTPRRPRCGAGSMTF